MPRMSEQQKNQIRVIPRVQRRVLGVMMEKAFTTPEQYPLTLKAATTGCNQKSNRDPVVDYSEDQVQQALDELRDSMLAAEVYSDGGRAARYRHYMRHNFEFSEAQFAIIAELLLRGRQQLGELRTRASRMVRIDSQDQLKEALAGLKEMGYLQTSGPLDRRGVEVDHTFYLPSENMALSEKDDAPEVARQPAAAASSAPEVSSSSPVATSEIPSGLLKQLEQTLQEQSAVISSLQAMVSDMEDRLQRLERDLGV
ncbi:MAG: DUF480 domain-containing protein [Planctomycetaceae bacterium]